MLTIKGEPMGKQRPKVTRYVTYTPAKTVNYETLIREMFMVEKCQKLDGALKLCILAYYSIPKSTSLKKKAAMIRREIRPTKKPDLDNVMKIVCDSLNKIAYDDDAQIVSAIVRKYYSDEPRLDIILEEVEEREVNA